MENKRQNGSALLLTLFVLIGIGGIILTVTRMVLGASRLSAMNDDRELASLEANSGIEELLNFLKSPAITYDGIITNAAGISQSTISRGFKGAACDTISADGSGADLIPPDASEACPWYAASMSPASKADNGQTILGDSDLPLGQTVLFNVSAKFSPVLSADNNVVTFTDIHNDGGVIYPQTKTLRDGDQVIAITRNGSLGRKGIYLSGASFPVTAARENYMCIQSTGHSGNSAVSQRIDLFYQPTDLAHPERRILDNATCQDHFPAPAGETKAGQPADCAKGALPTQGCVGWWKLDEGSGTIAHDSVNHNDLTLSYNTVYTPGGAAAGPSWVLGEYGNALKFAGGQYAKKDVVGGEIPVNSTARTASIWFRLDTGDPGPSDHTTDEFMAWGGNGILGDITGSVGSRFALAYWKPGGVRPDAPAAVGLECLYCGKATPFVNDGKWHMLTVVMPAGSHQDDVQIYLDGLLRSSTLSYNNPTAPPEAQAAGNPLLLTQPGKDITLGIISGTDWAYFMHGSLDDARVYSRVLSADEISAIYAAGR